MEPANQQAPFLGRPFRPDDDRLGGQPDAELLADRVLHVGVVGGASPCVRRGAQTKIGGVIGVDRDEEIGIVDDGRLQHRLNARLIGAGADRLDHDDPCRVGSPGPADRIDAGLEVHVQVRLCLRSIAAAGLIRLIEALQHQTAIKGLEGRGDLGPHRRDFGRHALNVLYVKPVAGHQDIQPVQIRGFSQARQPECCSSGDKS